MQAAEQQISMDNGKLHAEVPEVYWKTRRSDDRDPDLKTAGRELACDEDLVSGQFDPTEHDDLPEF